MYENKDADYVKSGFIILSVLTVIAFLLTVNHIRAHANSNYLNCMFNEKDIGEALEKYAEDNNGKYPRVLSLLVSKYLESIPTCPQAHKDTYSHNYKSSKDQGQFTFFCQGRHHENLGITEKNWPQYNSTEGLKARP